MLTRALVGSRFAIVFISNQAGAPKQQNAFKRKLPLLGKKLDIPFHAFAALSYDEVCHPAHSAGPSPCKVCRLFRHSAC